MRQKDRQARQQQRFDAQRVGRTPAAISLDIDVMMQELGAFKTSPDRIFVAFATPLPCDACTHLRNLGEGVTMSCECEFYRIRGPDGGRFFPKQRPCCPTCNKVRYKHGVFSICPCVELCRQQCIAAGSWKECLLDHALRKHLTNIVRVTGKRVQPLWVQLGGPYLWM